jgi:hypothetical protein
MSESELFERVKAGELLLVGEFRGARVEKAGYVDRKSGQAAQYLRASYIVECSCCGSIDRAIITQKLSTNVESPSGVKFPYVKGQRLVLALEGFKKERGHFLGWLGERHPEPLENGNPPTLVSTETIPHSL